MAITQGTCGSFKVALLNGEMDFSADTTQTFKIALYTGDADIGPDTTAYTTDNESSGTGYTAGGIELTIAENPTLDGTSAYVRFNNATFSSVTLSARGALIYSTTAGNPSVLVINFGENKTISGSNLIVTLNSAIDEILRLW